jgi:hypothetical protein
MSHHRATFRTFECIQWLCILGSQKAYNVYQLLTYNHYLKVLWLCVNYHCIYIWVLPGTPVVAECLAVSCEYRVTVCALVVPLRCVSDYLWAELLHWFCVLSFRVTRRGACFRVLLCCVGGFVPVILIVSCSGVCWLVWSGGWPSVLV